MLTAEAAGFTTSIAQIWRETPLEYRITGSLPAMQNVRRLLGGRCHG